MKKLIPTNGGVSSINGLDIKNTYVVVFDFKTLEIIGVRSNYTQADELACVHFRKGIDARFESLDFNDDSINAETIIGMKLTQFQHFVENNKHPLIAV